MPYNDIAFLVAGFVLLLVGGEYLVRGAVSIARRFGISPMVIGLTLVGFGTSAPELVASINAALKGSPGIAIGNVVGSNIANVFLVLGIAALIFPLATNREAYRRDGPVLILATAILVMMVLAGEIGRIAGAIGVALLVAYTSFTWWSDRRSLDAGAVMHGQEAEEIDEIPQSRMWVALLMAAGGMAAVLYGADLLVDGAIGIARGFGLSEAVIGLTIVAIGTSLPELATAVIAAWRRHADVAFGNIVGSCIFNIFGILGVTALVMPLAVPAEIALFDVWIAALAAIVFVIFAMTGWRIGRREGAVLGLLYVAYIAIQFSPGLRGMIGLG
jgi:cation:H+ antiporter